MESRAEVETPPPLARPVRPDPMPAYHPAAPEWIPEESPPRPPVEPRTPEEFWRAIAVPSITALVIAIVAGLIGGFIGAEYARTRTPVYESAAVLLFDNPATIALNPGSIVAIAQDRGKYAGLVGTDLISEPAALKAGVSAGEIAGSVHAVATPTTLNVLIVADAGSPRLAQTLALSVSQALVEFVTAEQRPFPANLRLQASITTNPRLGHRTSPTHKKELTTALAVGITTAIVVYVIGQIAADQVRVRRRTA